MRTLISVVSLALLLVPGVAAASSVYPGDIKSDLSLSYTPPCTICHQTNQGGSGTATQAFAVAMKANGLTGGANASALSTALTALETAGTDSDGDGTPDIEQLKAGMDPNTGATIDGSSSSGSTSVPAYGCGAHAQLAAGPLPNSPAPFLATMAAVAGLALTRRRRRC